MYNPYSASKRSFWNPAGDNSNNHNKVKFYPIINQVLVSSSIIKFFFPFYSIPIKKFIGKLLSGVVLIHDNARPICAKVTKGILKKFTWDVFNHPPYSPDLAMSDCYLFRDLIGSLGEQLSLSYLPHWWLTSLKASRSMCHGMTKPQPFWRFYRNISNTLLYIW